MNKEQNNIQHVNIDNDKKIKAPIIVTICSAVLLCLIIFVIPNISRSLNLGDDNLGTFAITLSLVACSLVFIVSSEWIYYFNDKIIEKVSGAWKIIFLKLPKILLVLSYISSFGFFIILTISCIISLTSGNYPNNNWVIIVFFVIMLIFIFLFLKFANYIASKIPEYYTHFVRICFMDVLTSTIMMLFAGAFFLVLFLIAGILLIFVLLFAFGFAKHL